MTVYDLSTSRVECDHCHHTVLVRYTERFELPTNWLLEGSNHICTSCRSLRGDFGEAAKENVAKLKAASHGP